MTATASPIAVGEAQVEAEVQATMVTLVNDPTLAATEVVAEATAIVETPVPTAAPPEPTVAVVEETATPVSAEIIPSSPQLITLRTSEVRDGTKTALYEQIKVIRGQVREIAFELNETRYDDEINCKAFQQGYEGVLTYAQRLDTSADLELPNFHYNRAIDGAIVDMRPLAARCEETIDAGLIQLPVEEFGRDAFEEHVEKINAAMMHINESLLWISGDPGKIKNHFVGVKESLQSYSQLLNRDVDQRCEALNTLFDSLTAPQLLTPRDVHSEAYRFYLLSSQAMVSGASELRELCRGYLPEDHPDAIRPPLPISAEAVTSAQSAADLAISHILTAIRLMDLQAAATPVELDIRLLSKRPAERDGWYELVFDVNVSDGQVQSGFIGGFPVDDKGQVTVIHSCAADFFDQAEVTLADGQFIETAKFSEFRGNVCN